METNAKVMGQRGSLEWMYLGQAGGSLEKVALKVKRKW